MRTLCILVLAALTAAVPLGSFAQAPPSAVIAEIHAAGSSHFSDPQIAAACGLKPGDAVTRELLQTAADRLAQLGLFSSVNYRFTTQGNGIVVEFQLADGPLVPVTFDNFPWFTDDELSAAIREDLPFFDGTAPQDGTLDDAMAAAISKLLEAHKITGTVEHTLLARPDSDAMTMQFHLEGPSPAIGSLDYGDTLAQASTKLQDRKNDLLNKPFSRSAIELFELEQIRPLYLSTGNLRVSFAAPVARFAGDPNHLVPSNVSVQIPIDPGPVFHFSGLSWDGNRALDASALSAMAPLQTGELADGMKLEDLWQRVEAAYARNGYIHAQVEPQPKFDDASATVSYNVAISEGQQYHMGGLVLTGLSSSAEGALRAQWQLPPGKTFDGTYVEKMLAKLEKPTREVFGTLPIHYDKMGHLLRVDENSHTIDVLIDFQ